jgi:hypothetical protein
MNPSLEITNQNPTKTMLKKLASHKIIGKKPIQCFGI